MSNTRNLNLTLTPDSPGAQSFKTWRQDINGENNSNMIKIDNAFGELEIKTSSEYEGVDLTVKFADEISDFTDEWAWIKNRIQTGNFSGIKVRDYIPITANGDTYDMQVAGINTYKGSGETGSRVTDHIDFISKGVWKTTHRYNTVNYNNGYNNGTTIQESPWLASDLYHWLNSKSGTVPSSTSAGGGAGTSVDYGEQNASDKGVYYYLPSSLKAVITEKRAYYALRYTENTLLDRESGTSWGSIGKLWLPAESEVYPHSIYGRQTVYNWCYTERYPIFYSKDAEVKYSVNNAVINYWLINAREGSGEAADHQHFVNANYRGRAYTSTASTTSNYVPICFRIEKTAS